MNNQARVCKLPCKYNIQNICSAYGDCISHEVFIEELEKIKTEIQEMRNDNPSYYYTCDVIEREKLLDLIDEHISELKGENNEG